MAQEAAGALATAGRCAEPLLLLPSTLSRSATGTGSCGLLAARCMVADEGRIVWEVQVRRLSNNTQAAAGADDAAAETDGGEAVAAAVTRLVVKSWARGRLCAGNGANSAQVFQEMRLALSSLDAGSFVPCVHVSLNTHEALLFYPHGGHSMRHVCDGLRMAGNKDALERVLTRMAAEVLLAIRKLRGVQPKPLVHHDIKLDSILLGEDGKMRLCDMGLLREANDTSSGVDPNYLPPDYCFVLPSGLFTYEDPVALAAANTWVLDARGLGMALLCGWAGRLPDAVSVEAEASFPPPAGYSRFKWALEEAPVKQQLMQRLRIWRIAKHDWAASIDALMHDCPRLAALAKLLLGPRAGLTSLDSLLRHEAIKPVVRDVLETSRKTRQAWQAAITAASEAVPQVEAALAAVHLQHQQQQQLGVAAAEPEPADTARSVVRCRVDTGKLQPLMLGAKLRLLHEQYKQQQLEKYKQQRAEAEAAAAASCVRTEGGAEHALGSSSSSSSHAATPSVAGCPDQEPAAPQQSPPRPVRAEDPALELEILRERLRATQARLASRDSDVERLQLLVQGLQRSIVSLQNLDSRAWRQQEQQEQGQQQGRTSVPGAQAPAAAAGMPAQAAAEPAAAPRPAAGVRKAVWHSLPGGGWGFVAVVMAMCVLWAARSGKQNKFR